MQIQGNSLKCEIFRCTFRGIEIIICAEIKSNEMVFANKIDDEIIRLNNFTLAGLEPSASDYVVRHCPHH